jgi:hypothetical protein
MKLKRLSFKDRTYFGQFLHSDEHELSAYVFENIYIWKGLFDIYWAVIKDNLCVFFKDHIGCFAYISPQGKAVDIGIIEELFRTMDRFNKNQEISRIENIEAQDIGLYRSLGYECKMKDPEYLCRRIDLVRLSTDKFKSKRSCFNYFIKNYRFRYLAFDSQYSQECLRLYQYWMQGRKNNNPDPVYQSMLEDGWNCLGVLLHNFRHLQVIGRVIEIDGKIKAFTFGFRLNPETFCILYEITDLSIKGISQFIFRRFCEELKEYKYINLMDDSGLDNLKKCKLSYQPIKLIPNYIVSREKPKE